VGKKLGQGAFGEVIQAMRDDTNEQVAVKQIPIRVDDDRHQEKIMVRCFR
jgi:serine/threonine protein kinase